MKKGFLSVTLTAAMTAALLAGCGSSAQQSAAGASTAAAGLESSQGAAPSAEAGDGKTIKIGVFGPVCKKDKGRSFRSRS